jgi:thymidylate kinase
LIQKLKAVGELLDTLDAEQIVHCHWKSNEHLEAGLVGETDVDMLVAVNDVNICGTILQNLGWLYDSAPPFTEMEHWVGFDVETGNLLHVHLHTAGLPVGPTKRKFFTLPQDVSDWILATRIRLDGVWVAAPEAELYMLLLRISLKSTLRNLVAAYVRRRDVMPDKQLRKELTWLLDRVDSAHQLKCPVLPATLTKTLQELLVVVRDPTAKPLTYLPAMIKVRFLLIPYVKPTRLIAKRKIGGKTLGCPTPVFAFVGVDGSGKTSQVIALQKWLRWKFNAQRFYLGTPKKSGFGGILFRITRRVGGKIIFSFYASGYRLLTSKQASAEARQGKIVLTDRYPIPQLWGVTDGPRLSGYLSKLEQQFYRKVAPPGFLFVLKVSEEKLIERDPSVNTESRMHKMKGILKLNPQASDVPMYVVDASRTFDEVHIECKRVIFKELQALQQKTTSEE